MTDFEKLGLHSRVAAATATEERVEIRLTDGGAFVAWFQRATRISDGETITSTNTQFVHRRELTSEQVQAVKSWLNNKVLTAM